MDSTQVIPTPSRRPLTLGLVAGLVAMLAIAVAAIAGRPTDAADVAVLGIPLDFILFGLTLLGVAVFHHKTLQVAVTGLAVVTLYKLLVTGFATGSGLLGLLGHLGHEWVVIANLFCLLTGFALLADHFESSELPKALPRVLPRDWKGAFALLCIVFVLSSFLDNIAAALIGGAMAHSVFNKKLHIGYIAAIVAASNAGGSGSVVGDTTTTMMWISGIAPRAVFHAYAAAVVALCVCGVAASMQQHAFSPIRLDEAARPHVDWSRMGIVGIILSAAIAVNIGVNARYPQHADAFPFIGVAVWVTILVTAPWRRPNWGLLPAAVRGSCFLLSLVLAATMMPVEKLSAASWQTTFGLGFLSAVFDNIPLTALAIKQGGYDWGVLAYAVGFGGSMMWFGSSAGVAISSMYPEARSVVAWVRHGWHVAVAYVLGFVVLIAVLGWQPIAHEDQNPAPSRPLVTEAAAAG